MASLFKPPQSARSNHSTPKLRLPTIPTELETPGSNIVTPQQHEQKQRDRLRADVSPVPPSATSSTTKSPISLKRRPVPPPIPAKLDVEANQTQKRSKVPPSVMNTASLENSIRKLDIKTPTGSETPNDDIMRPETQQGIYTRQDLNNSTDSYFSNFISTYEQNSSSTNTSPLKPEARTPITAGTDDVPVSEDVDQLDKDIWQYSFMKNEIETLGMLGEGAGGSVAKCKLKHGKNIFALKTINTLNTDPEFQKQIFRELQFNRSFKSDYIVRYYGMFTDESNSSIFIAMEYMGGKSLDAIYKNLLKRNGKISEKVLGKIAEDVLRGLSYLHEKKVIHRDIKPQNILLNDRGEVKLCDFGVSGEAVNSLATTFTGTSFYMAPERIKGEPYSVTCDVWSLGLTILEVAEGHFPFGSEKINNTIAPIELLVYILTFTPELKDEPEIGISWTSSFKSFIEYCLKKDPRERPSPRQMIQHPWIQGQMKKKVNMAKFIKRCWDNEPQ
ncbi:mitogen-activated protein kinase kinase MKK1 KNAG_0A03060 [Huiozyma naganishii CBS 8797]|uniref:mitogen-activated protein kinase kinase n=1 Tax=Huiozyma naganishii (strain ATCC MYA-139 / BCRC 22969 / CBS 8797 / KCTC 17520 / NBRC 10181 / NCYC 3082 / Yp74L-3) TaxID=1071383 RepID=J7S271_HUIN7|nr:hypothetical protein KNAG_0A03060 [Kazachstania naganishii CBS 8797]CCK67994.1 hypothetical protein KNAG_0A03060 [Kazachstania naganishii CBS 8797]